MQTVRIATFGFLLTLMACATPAPLQTPVQMQNKFDYALHKPYTQQGTNTIRGQGFLRQKGGGVVTCAGQEVLLSPATPYFREIANNVLSGKTSQIEPIRDPAYASIIKKSQCDGQGNFTFRDLPNGSFFLLTQVKWSVGYEAQGGALMKEVRLNNGETKEVILTDKDFIGR
jgi:hypothetical protein